jgi:hypothetical protein
MTAAYILPKSAIATTAFSRDSSTQSYYTKEQMQSAYADGIKAEQERCLKIAYEACAPYGKPGECCWITIKSNVRNTK